MSSGDISVIGLGAGGSKIAKEFEQYSVYNVYALDWLQSYEKPEDYEKNMPDLRDYFSNLNDRVQFFVVGSSYSSNYALGVLEQIRDKQIELFYVKPDTELLAGVPKLVERAAFGVLQEYARSGLFKSITLLNNLNIEQILQSVPIKKYYETLNKTIASTVHYVNYFEHNDPIIGVSSKPPEIARIRSIGALDMDTLEEKWFFNLDIDRDVCYYLCVNKDRLENDGGLHKKYVEILKNKPRNAFRNISYAIYETESQQDFGFCVSLTNAVQKNS
jgi:hypothetical protein